MSEVDKIMKNKIMGSPVSAINAIPYRWIDCHDPLISAQAV